jgi:hypothetical protein
VSKYILINERGYKMGFKYTYIPETKSYAVGSDNS